MLKKLILFTFLLGAILGDCVIISSPQAIPRLKEQCQKGLQFACQDLQILCHEGYQQAC